MLRVQPHLPSPPQKLVPLGFQQAIDPALHLLEQKSFQAQLLLGLDGLSQASDCGSMVRFNTAVILLW